MNLYQSLLGSEWDQLHPNVQRGHTAPLEANGTVDVEITPDPLGKWIARKLGIPSAGSGLPCKLKLDEEADGNMLWTRTFGSECFVSRQRLSGDRVLEVFESGAIEFEIIEELGRIRYTSTGGKLLGIEAPVAPSVSALVWPTDAGWRTEVEVKIPVKGRIARYVAVMVPL